MKKVLVSVLVLVAALAIFSGCARENRIAPDNRTRSNEIVEVQPHDNGNGTVTFPNSQNRADIKSRTGLENNQIGENRTTERRSRPFRIPTVLNGRNASRRSPEQEEFFRIVNKHNSNLRDMQNRTNLDSASGLLANGESRDANGLFSEVELTTQSASQAF